MQPELVVVDATDNKTEESVALLALIGAALALPGIGRTAEQGYRSDDTTVGFHHAEYNESGNRMSVTADQISITLPFGLNAEANFTATRDVTSGASPVINFLDADGIPQQFLETGASIKDQRNIYEGSVSYYGDSSLTSVKLGNSKEDDYRSDFASIGFQIDLNEQLGNLSFAYGHSEDTVWNSYNPSVLLEEPSEFHRRKKDEFSIGFGHVLNKNSLFQLSLTYGRSDGYLSDPYKKTIVVEEGIVDFRELNVDVAGIFRFLVESGLIQSVNDSGITEILNNSQLIDIPQITEFVIGMTSDNRPPTRKQIISLLRFSHYFKFTNSALHLDYRYSDDVWEVYSHTVEFKWNLGLGMGWQISPGLRYYTQHSAYFYNTFFESIPDHGYLSSDYRLAGFGARSKKLEISKSFNPGFTLYLHYEKYGRRYDYEFHGQTEGSDLDDYSYSLFSLSFDVSF